VRQAELPWPRFNTTLRRFEVDVLWAEQHVVVEVDGYAFHGHRSAFERDRRRDQALVAAGYTVIRVTTRQLVDEPMAPRYGSRRRWRGRSIRRPDGGSPPRNPAVGAGWHA
jgi:hypothetical protein